MGLIRTGAYQHSLIPHNFVLRMRDTLKISSFIETGTCMGRTAEWAAIHFRRVLTVEHSKIMYEKAVSALGHIRNIKFTYGDSRDVLRAVCPSLNEPTVFWLDSHWSGADTWGEDDECPLLPEIEAIHKSPVAHIILIDDARMFLLPPPPPHNCEQWPSLDVVIQALQAGKNPYYVSLLDDVIIAVPEPAIKIAKEYFLEAQNQQKGTMIPAPECSVQSNSLQTDFNRLQSININLLDKEEAFCREFIIGEPLTVSVACQSEADLTNSVIAISIQDQKGDTVLCADTREKNISPSLDPGNNVIKCLFSSLPLMPGNYSVSLWLGKEGQLSDTVSNAAEFTIIPEPIENKSFYQRKPSGWPICYTKTEWCFSHQEQK